VFCFKPGFANRRINITMLFGDGASPLGGLGEPRRSA
jgi:hypothetical protein